MPIATCASCRTVVAIRRRLPPFFRVVRETESNLLDSRSWLHSEHSDGLAFDFGSMLFAIRLVTRTPRNGPTRIQFDKQFSKFVIKVFGRIAPECGRDQPLGFAVFAAVQCQ